MTDTVDVDRCFTISAYLAFAEMHLFQKEHPNLSVEESINTIRQVRSSASDLDYRGAKQLMSILDWDMEWDATQSSLRRFITKLVEYSDPFWLRYIPSGREKVREALSMDVSQCLREAGLFDPMPDVDTIEWWDKLAANIRGRIDTEQMSRARHAERLSIEYESKRLSEIGIRKVPEWVSLEDNTIGYDILSYDQVDTYIVSKLIEVKSTLNNTIYISRNEWRNASTSIDQTVFHVWVLPSEDLYEFTVTEMKDHIPNDQGDGIWQEVKVTI